MRHVWCAFRCDLPARITKKGHCCLLCGFSLSRFSLSLFKHSVFYTPNAVRHPRFPSFSHPFLPLFPSSLVNACR